MLSYTALRNLYGVLTASTTSTNLTNGDLWINYAQRVLIGANNGDYTEATATDTTVASQQNYDTPYNYEKMNSVTVTVGTFKYPATEITARKQWNQLQLSTNVTSSYAQYYFIDAGQVYLWPTPSASGNTITYSYKQAVRDLQNADYTTGTVTLANGSTTVTGNGTTFTSAMVGRYLKSNTDGFWYKIASFTSTTVMTLDKAWQGTGASGLAFTIGEMPIVPEEFHISLVDYAVKEYWLQQGELTRAVAYAQKWEDAVQRCMVDSGDKTTGMVVDPGFGEPRIINPNFTILLS